MRDREHRRRLRVAIHGAVQGVGFRPFVYRLAKKLGLAGWVINDAAGVRIMAEGPRERLEEFRTRLETDRPPLAVILSFESSWLDSVGFEAFEIRQSRGEAAPSVLVMPDVATCPDCLADITNQANRRQGYPFTNCTNCGPRYSIIGGLPYDRPLTTMAAFQMCPVCDDEYKNPDDRRFHAQPNACPACGPQLELWDRYGRVVAKRGKALEQAATALRRGQIVALKGLGGYQLLVDARDPAAVARLRARKQREEKPLAVMFPDLAAVRAACELGPAEAHLLESPASPIVLLRKRGGAGGLAGNVAPSNPYLGVMVPYTPLHHLLLNQLQFPVVATSGNLSEEPMAIDEAEVLERLGAIVDLFLVHNRPILRHVDDSLVRLVGGRELVLRRARGYAPLPITFGERGLKEALAGAEILAVGPHLKNTVALATGGRVFLSQHIGDLATAEAYGAFERTIADLSKLLEFQPQAVACDLHPDYLSTKYAAELAAERGLPLVRVQHHEAHIGAAMAENDLAGPVFGVSWDGTGYGSDGTVWGGEFFVGGYAGFQRVGHLRTFRLPGANMAVREPRRSALGLLHELGRLRQPEPETLGLKAAEMEALVAMAEKGLNSPLTSSAGRLFDGVSALLGLKLRNAYEGQAAMALEFALPAPEQAAAQPPYPLQLRAAEAAGTAAGEGGGFALDWSPLVEGVLADREAGVAPGLIAARFHNGLVEGIVTAARHVGQERVVLSGGCFQNVYLAERTAARLAEEGFAVYTHQRIPPNDGGVALGQAVMAASHELSE